MAEHNMKRVLIVEDADDICSTLAMLLHDEGYEVECASNGRVALDRLRSLNDTQLPGLILLDIMMPEMDGVEFAAAQQQDARLAPIPVVLMTAGGDIESKARAIGARGYLKKPFKDVDTLLGTVSRWF